MKRKMKKAINFFFCLLLVLAGCKDDEDPYIFLSATELNFTKTAGEQTVDINTNVPWKASISPSSAASWLTVTPNTADAGATITVSVRENDSYDDRTVSISILSEAGTQTLQVAQSKTDAMQLIGDKEYACWQPGGMLPITIRKNIEYTVEISSMARSWIHHVTTKGLISEEVNFRIDENTTEVWRYGEIYLLGKASDSGTVMPELSDTIKIFQQELALSIDYEELQFGSYAQTKYVTVSSTHQYCPHESDDSFTASDYTYALSDGAANWCKVEKNEDTPDFLSVTVTDNTTGQARTADVTITSSALSRTVRIEQQPDTGSDYYSDGELKTFQNKSRGKGVNLIIMGDGFTKGDLQKGGFYETTMSLAVDYFFSVEPFKSHRDYFNVYMIAAESEEEGVNDSETPYAPKVNNKFNSTIGKGTHITWNGSLCAQYVHQALPQFTLGESYIKEEVLVILVLNTPRYAGTTSMYSNGYCVAACPMSANPSPYDFRGLVHHEAGGHGFGLFEDEYIYTNTTIPNEDVQSIKGWQKKYGFYQNVDFTGNITQIRWKDFIGHDKYPYVGAYEGACTYQYGVWRSEEISCMDYNIPYFSALCRYIIVKRIMRLAGEADPTFAEFAARDDVPPYTDTKALYREMPPLGRPRMIEVH